MKKKATRVGVKRRAAGRTGSTAASNRVAPAKNAYELLQRVCKAITREPRVYDQSLWVITKALMSSGMYARKPSLQPPCGTSFCIAGHIVAQHDGVRKAVNLDGLCHLRAIDLLGVGDADVRSLFSAIALGLDAPAAGTAAYARLGVRLVRGWMKENEARLKARSLKGV